MDRETVSADVAAATTTAAVVTTTMTTDYYEGISGFGMPDWFETMFGNSPWMSDPHFNGCMPAEFQRYHPYVCNCCKRGPLQLQKHIVVDLFRCSACKVVKYCSRDHQKKDWPNHKIWCKSFVKVMKEQKETEKKDNNNKEDGDGDQKVTREDMDSWRRRMMNTSGKIMHNMQRLMRGTGGGQITSGMLNTVDNQIYMLQPSCHKCLRSGCQDDVELVVCPHCSGVAVCKRCLFLGDDDAAKKKKNESRMMEWSCFHDSEDECKKYLILLCCLGLTVENGSSLLATSDTNMETTIFQPNDWNDYFREKGNDFDTGSGIPISQLRMMAPMSAFLTDGLSIPLTVQYVLGRNVLSLLNESKEKLCIHVLGAAGNEYLYQRAWVELGRLNPQLKQIDIVYVGPDVLPKDDSSTFNLNNALMPHETKLTNCCGTIHRFHGLYHEKYSDILLSCPTPPDLLVAFHSGISDENHFIKWYGTMEHIASLSSSSSDSDDNNNVPFCITGYNHKEVEDDIEKLTNHFDMEVKIPATANPFRGMRPHLDPGREGSDFIFGNASYAVLY